MVKASRQIPQIIQVWVNAISLKNPRLMTNFYCKNAVLVGTFSTPYELGSNEIYEYFVGFLNAKKMSCKILEQVCQHTGSLKVSSGVYEFTIDGQVTKARFTYTIISVNGEDKILNHHSSIYDDGQKQNTASNKCI